MRPSDLTLRLPPNLQCPCCFFCWAFLKTKIPLHQDVRLDVCFLCLSAWLLFQWLSTSQGQLEVTEAKPAKS